MHRPTGRPKTVYCLLAAAAAGLLVCEAVAAPQQAKVPVPRARPIVAAERAPAAEPLTRSLAPASAAIAPAALTDLPAVKRALELIRRRSFSEALEIQPSLQDPAARKLIEWAFLRSDDGGAQFDRYVAFIEANPGWPSFGLMRRRAEGTLWEEGKNAATVRAYFATTSPMTAKGKFALARALIAQGDRATAQQLVREGWRADNCSEDIENEAIETFRDLIGTADHKARMDRRLYGSDSAAAMRAAQRVGPTAVAIARARLAVNAKAANAQQLLDAVPAEAHNDIGLTFSRIQFLRRHDRIDEAARLMLAVPRIDGWAHDLDEWWVERRLVARKLLDQDEARAAYQVARDAVPPPKENYRGEHQFTAGWIALRFLNEPAVALNHFVKIAEGVSNPITLARSEYWQGRALEALGRRQEAQAHFQAAAQFPTAYYGQIARARLGHGEIALRHPESAGRISPAGLEVARAVEYLYAANERGLVIPFVADLGERNSDVGALAKVGEITGRHNDARSMLLVGKSALGRGHALDQYAFPAIGVPNFTHVGPEIDRSVVYSIVRQESAFNPGDLSSAQAMGLMQVTPEAGRYVAKKFNIRFDVNRLRSDMVYNTQMGAAELGDLLVDYRGSYILAFAGYNAGRGRVRDWVARYGDPRDPNVDPIDWVERIPFSETRNYVQRVLENLQVYRVRFGHGSKLMIEADLRRGSSSN